MWETLRNVWPKLALLEYSDQINSCGGNGEERKEVRYFMNRTQRSHWELGSLKWEKKLKCGLLLHPKSAEDPLKCLHCTLHSHHHSIPPYLKTDPCLRPTAFALLLVIPKSTAWGMMPVRVLRVHCWVERREERKGGRERERERPKPQSYCKDWDSINQALLKSYWILRYSGEENKHTSRNMSLEVQKLMNLTQVVDHYTDESWLLYYQGCLSKPQVIPILLLTTKRTESIEHQSLY